MSLILVTPPATTPVSLADAKANLRFDSNDEDDFITSCIETATQYLDGRDGLLGRALITQTWRLTLDCFPPCVHLPLPPCQSVQSVTYLDTDGGTQTLATDGYAVTGIGDEATIYCAKGKSWPATYRFPGAVSVTFTAGYGDNPSDVPAPLRSAMLLHVGLLFANREAATQDNPQALPILGVADHVERYRVRGF